MNQLALIGIRIVSLYLIASSLTNAISVLGGFAASGFDSINLEAGLYIAIVVSPIIIGILLWALSAQLARFVTAQNTVDIPYTSTGHIEEGSFLIGVYLIATHIPNLSISIFNYKKVSNIGGGWEVATAEYAIWENAIFIIMGCLLVTGSRMIKIAFNKLRTFGQNA